MVRYTAQLAELYLSKTHYHLQTVHQDLVTSWSPGIQQSQAMAYNNQKQD
jgi:hypothetical protein